MFSLVPSVAQEVVTEDSDALVCGAPSIIRGFWSLEYAEDSGAAFGRKQGAERVHREAFMRDLGLDDARLVTACVLAGCDFAPKLRNVGLKKALKAVRLCGSDLPACLHFLKHGQVAEDRAAMEQFEAARKCLAPPPGPAEVGFAGSAPSPPCDEALESFLQDVEAEGEPLQLRAILLPSEKGRCENEGGAAVPAQAPQFFLRALGALAQ